MDTLSPRPTSGAVKPGWVLMLLVIGLAALVHAAQCAPTITNLMSTAAVVHTTPDPTNLDTDTLLSDDIGDAAGLLAVDVRTVLRAEPHAGTDPQTMAVAACLLLLVVFVMMLVAPDTRQTTASHESPSSQRRAAHAETPATSSALSVVLRT